MLHVLTHARVLTPDGWRDDLAVLLDGDAIVGIVAVRARGHEVVAPRQPGQEGR